MHSRERSNLLDEMASANGQEIVESAGSYNGCGHTSPGYITRDSKPIASDRSKIIRFTVSVKFLDDRVMGAFGCPPKTRGHDVKENASFPNAFIGNPMYWFP